MPEIWFPHLNIEIEHLSRVAFSVFGFEIYWYSICIITGIFSGLLLAVQEAKRTGQDPELYYDFVFYGGAAAIVCARIYYVAFSWSYYKQNWIEIFYLRNGGIAIYGGIIGGFIASVVFSKVKKINWLLLLDTCAPSLALGQAIGRWGNFVNREAFGGYTDGLFALRYQLSQVQGAPASVLEKVVEVNGVSYIQVQPTFLYESMWNVVLVFLLLLYKKKKRFDGEIIALYFIGYGIGRAWIEGLRTDQLQFLDTGIAVSQVLSVVFVGIAAMYLWVQGRKMKTEGNR